MRPELTLQQAAAHCIAALDALRVEEQRVFGARIVRAGRAGAELEAVLEAVDALRELLSLAQGKTCEWTDNGNFKYVTTCRRKRSALFGRPKFCDECGGRVVTK